MRIIAGLYKGRKIDCPEGDKIRPTSDMLRSAVFNILQFRVEWENSQVLDACCGTGAFGIEAISRGAKFVSFIDASRESLDVTKHNLTKLNVPLEKFDMMLHAIEALPEARRRYDIIYLDPPYLKGLVPKGLKSLAAKNWIAEGAIILAEIAERDKIEMPPGFTLLDERKYGNSKLLKIKHA